MKQGHEQITAPAQAADQIERLRVAGVSLIYDPATKTLRTDGMNATPVAVGLVPQIAKQVRKEANHQAEHPLRPKPCPGHVSLCSKTAAYGELSCPRLEPLAYLLHPADDVWLDVRGSA